MARAIAIDPFLPDYGDDLANEVAPHVYLATDNATDPTVYTGADFGVVQAAVVFWEVATDADHILMCYLDGASFPITTNGGDLTLQFDAVGVFTLD